ncbi:hypothetical protein CLOM_g10222 [Closterium sp. NIES-68]|nr:hypothetical protein CLOM_g10222 [Closterium sp. NIES-68]GJP64991.1 hypothetical protein CLOP_g21920 [Closterium sp. NIES-67]
MAEATVVRWHRDNHSPDPNVPRTSSAQSFPRTPCDNNAAIRSPGSLSHPTRFTQHENESQGRQHQHVQMSTRVRHPLGAAERPRESAELAAEGAVSASSRGRDPTRSAAHASSSRNRVGGLDALGNADEGQQDSGREARDAGSRPNGLSLNGKLVVEFQDDDDDNEGDDLELDDDGDDMFTPRGGDRESQEGDEEEEEEQDDTEGGEDANNEDVNLAAMRGLKASRSRRSMVSFAGRHGASEEEEEEEDDEGYNAEVEQREKLDQEVVQAMYERMKHMGELTDNFKNLFFFLCYTCLYLAVLYLQADASLCYQVATAHNVLLPPDYTAAAAMTMSSPDDFYTWINDSIIQVVWKDPICGNGICERPLEFEAFGRFGCSADCGDLGAVSNVTVHVATDFHSQADAAASSWNLCLDAPSPLCWYPEDQPFSDLASDSTVTLALPDGVWSVVVNAPGGGVAGTVRLAASPTSPVAAAAAAAAAAGTNASSSGSSSSSGSNSVGGLGRVLLEWGGCQTSDITPLSECRSACSRFSGCLADYCGASGYSPPALSSLFVTCASACNDNSSLPFLPFPDFTCPEIINATADGLAGFQCSYPTNSTLTTGRKARGLWERAAQAVSRTSSWHQARQATRKLARKRLAENAVAAAASALATVSANNTSIWTHLGATDAQRITSLRVAVSRAIYTAVKDNCLVGSPLFSPRANTPSSSSSPSPSRRSTRSSPSILPPVLLSPMSRSRLSAFLCTLFGGAEAAEKVPGCVYASSREGQQLVSVSELAGDVPWTVATNQTVQLSRDQAARFILLLTAALKSAVLLPDDDVADAARLLHAFDPVVVDPSLPGCGTTAIGPTVMWGASKHPSTVVRVGERVTWVWADGQPHAINVAGFGDAAATPFYGMGSGRLVVSADMVCGAGNVGPTAMPINGSQPADADPAPCVLSPTVTTATSSPPTPFTYTTVFPVPGTFVYECARVGEPTRGSITVLPSPSPSSSTSSSSSASSSSRSHAATGQSRKPIECAPGCVLSSLADGNCNPPCNVDACAFDGGDCACSLPPTSVPVPAPSGSALGSGIGPVGFVASPQHCPCPPGQVRSDEGSCCMTSAIGEGLSFSFTLDMFSNATSAYASNATSAPMGGNASANDTEEVALSRYVAEQNRVLIGLKIEQTRWDGIDCQPSRFSALFPHCINGTSTDPFGVNPYFLPSSSLYDPSALVALNDSLPGADVDNVQPITVRDDGIPYGFQVAKPGENMFPVIFDINLDNEAATRRLQYLADSFFIDNSTQSISVAMLTYNGDSSLFVYTTVRLNFEIGGKIAVTYNVDPVDVELYSSAADWARLTVTLLYVCAVVWNLIEELVEAFQCWLETGRITSYFRTLWNWLDVLSLTIQFIGIIMWFIISVQLAGSFQVQPRYNIYVTGDSPFVWQLHYPPVGYDEAQAVYSSVRNLVQWRSILVSLQGINVFLFLLRLLKLMDFQPRIAILTRTMAAAFPALVHFFLLWAIMFIGFSLYAYVVFGRTLEQFSTVAMSMVSCFLILINDNSTGYFFIQLEGWNLTAAIIFWIAYITVMVFVMLNVLIAIVVDAFLEVRKSTEESPAFPVDMWYVLRNVVLRLSTDYWKPGRLQRHLLAMGAEDDNVTLEDSIVAKSVAALKGSFRRVNRCCGGGVRRPKPRPRKVLRVGKRCLNADSLIAVIERCTASKPAGSDSTRGGFLLRRQPNPEPTIEARPIADVVLAQFGEVLDGMAAPAAPSREEEQRQEEETRKLKETLARVSRSAAMTAEGLEELKGEVQLQRRAVRRLHRQVAEWDMRAIDQESALHRQLLLQQELILRLVNAQSDSDVA